MSSFTDNFSKYNFPNLGWARVPKPPISDKDKENVGLKGSDSNAKFLAQLCYLGFEKKLESGKIKKEESQKYIDRCKFELDTFEELGFVDYILLVWTIIKKAQELGVFLDMGRGSVSSSTSCWFLQISGCDPIKNNLFFSRFISKARAESKIVDGETWISLELAPDIDLNLGEGRDEIVKWLKEIYPNRISKILTVNTMTGKLCVKEVYKVLDEASEEDAKRISDMIERQFGVVQAFEDVYKENKDFKQWADSHKETYEISLKLENLIKNFGSHASGYLCSFDELIDHTPLVLDTGKELTSSYIMDDVQCLKIDLLNLDTNKIIKEILGLTKIDVDALNLENDPFIYEKVSKGKLLPYGLYQISAPCAYKVALNLEPKNVMEMSHVNAIARPAALRYEHPYIENKAKCPHPIFEEALSFTRFQPLYQEQTIMMVKAIGFDEESAEMFRRTFAKKKVKEIKDWVKKIKIKLEEKNLPKEPGDILIKLAEESANYQFNLSHSLSISYLTALTIYLKYKHPLEFFFVCLNEVKEKPNFVEHIGQIKDELGYFNIELRPPSLIHSDLSFKIKDGNIYHGLSSIKGISDKTIEKLNKFRHPYSNKFEIFSSANEAGLNIAVQCSLIAVGCLSEFEKESNRARLMLEAQLWNLLTDKEKRECLKLGEQFKYDLIKLVKSLKDLKNEKGKPIIKESRYQTIKKYFVPFYKMYEFNSKNLDFLKYWFEKKYLGYSYSTNLFSIFKPETPDLTPISAIPGCINNEIVRCVGEITEPPKTWKSKGKKTPCLKLVLKDESGQIECLAFDTEQRATIEEIKENNGGELPKEGDICVAVGEKKGDCIFMKRLGVQECQIFEKISQVIKEEKTEITT